MRIYKKYLIKNLFKPLIVSLITLTAILWSSRVTKFMDLIVQDGAEFLTFFNLTLLILPPLILMILPLTVFLTTILTYNKLIENREIIILKNCGIKKVQLLNPLIILSIIITIFSYGFSLYGAYKSNLAIREIREKIRNSISFTVIKGGAFSNFKNLVIYADKKDEKKAYNILIYQKAEKLNEKNLLLQAELASIEGNIITLYNGNFQRFNNDYKEIPDILFFKEHNIKFEELISDSENKILKIDSLSTLKLIKIMINYDKFDKIFTDKNAIIYEINYRLTFPLLSIIMALLSGSLMLEGTFNRINNSEIIIKTSVISIIAYVTILSLYQKVADGIIYLYILYTIIISILIASLYLIKEKRNIIGSPA